MTEKIKMVISLKGNELRKLLTGEPMDIEFLTIEDSKEYKISLHIMKGGEEE